MQSLEILFFGISCIYWKRVSPGTASFKKEKSERSYPKNFQTQGPNPKSPLWFEAFIAGRRSSHPIWFVLSEKFLGVIVGNLAHPQWEEKARRWYMWCIDGRCCGKSWKIRRNSSKFWKKPSKKLAPHVIYHCVLCFPTSWYGLYRGNFSSLNYFIIWKIRWSGFPCFS